MSIVHDIEQHFERYYDQQKLLGEQDAEIKELKAENKQLRKLLLEAEESLQ